MNAAKNTKSLHPGWYFTTESRFCSLFPLSMRELNEVHWAPLTIIRRAVHYLVQNEGSTILDIGSGIGKFCLAGAWFKPEGRFHGVEQRLNLIEQATAANEKLGRLPVTFHHRNFTQMALDQYDGFFFYNAFFENLPGAYQIDDSIDCSRELYDYYSNYMYNGLSDLKPGTRIVTYCSWDDEIPPGYKLEEWYEQGLLKCWIKK